MNYTIKVRKFVIYSLNVAITVMEGFLIFRFVLKLLAAQASPFVQWVYDVSDGLLSPFEGMFAPFISSGGHILEFTTIFTIAFYALMYYFIYQLVNVLADVIQKSSKPPASSPPVKPSSEPPHTTENQQSS